jgi:hypothetical protein
MVLKKITAVLLVFILLIIFSPVQAQRFDTLLTRLDAEYPQEKLYCQFDKAVYNPGETIWFKAYKTIISALYKKI